MKLLSRLLLACLLAVSWPALAQPGADVQAQPQARGETDVEAGPEATPWAPETGDAVVDARLADINRYAARYPDAFIDELVRYFDAPRPLLEDLLLEQGRVAGDLYYACALARVSGRPCRGVLEARASAPDERWEVIARGLGVAPGDVRAKRLRAGIADSYAHWGRPLPDDD